MNLWVLSLAIKRMDFVITKKRMLAVAIFSSLFYFVGILFISNYLVHIILNQLLTYLLVIFFLLQRRYRRHGFYFLLHCIKYALIIAGLILLIFRFVGAGNVQCLSVSSILLLGFFLYKSLAWCIRFYKRREGIRIYPVSLKGVEEEINIMALYDTGNSLTDPISQKPVCIVEEDVLAKITLENPLYMRAIPYRSVGQSRGMLYGVELSELCIYLPDRTIIRRNVICASINQSISSSKQYRMILHPQLLVE